MEKFTEYCRLYASDLELELIQNIVIATCSMRISITSSKVFNTVFDPETGHLSLNELRDVGSYMSERVVMFTCLICNHRSIGCDIENIIIHLIEHHRELFNPVDKLIVKWESQR